MPCNFRFGTAKESLAHHICVHHVMHKDESAKEGHCRVLDPLERLIANYALTEMHGVSRRKYGAFSA